MRCCSISLALPEPRRVLQIMKHNDVDVKGIRAAINKASGNPTHWLDDCSGHLQSQNRLSGAPPARAQRRCMGATCVKPSLRRAVSLRSCRLRIQKGNISFDLPSRWMVLRWYMDAKKKD